MPSELLTERIGAVLAAKVAAALDGDAGFGLVLLDEGVDDEALPPSLAERVALTVRPVASALPDPARIERACATWRDVRVADERIEAIAAVAQALGVGSARATWQALCVTRIAAALDGRAEATDDDVARAARAHGADVVALSFSSMFGATPAQRELRRLRSALPETTEIWAGGACPGLTGFVLPGLRNLPQLAGVADAVAAWSERRATSLSA